MVGIDHRPPCLVAVPVDAVVPAHRHAGLVREARLVLVRVELEAVDAEGERPVALRLHRSGVLLPVLRARGERLRADDGTPHRVRDGDRLHAAVLRRTSHALRPELAHRHVRHRAGRDVAARIHVVRFARHHEPLAVRKLLDGEKLVLDHELLRGLPPVEEESLGDFRRLHHASVDRGDVRKRRIAAPALELLEELGGTVLRAHLPAVEVERGEAASGTTRTGGGEDFVRIVVQVALNRAAVKLARLESETRPRRGTRGLSGEAAPHAQDRPASFGDVPGEASGGVHFRREVHHLRGIDALLRRHRLVRRREVRLHAAAGRKRRALVDGLFVRIGKTFRALRLRERQYGDVAVVALPFLLHLGRERADAKERRARCGDGQNK